MAYLMKQLFANRYRKIVRYYGRIVAKHGRKRKSSKDQNKIFNLTLRDFRVVQQYLDSCLDLYAICRKRVKNL